MARRCRCRTVGVELSVDVGTWHLESGTVRLMRPVDPGLGRAASTGLVFEGSGRFHMAVPDAVELEHLRRSAEDESLDGLDVRFGEMVLRFSQPEVADAFAYAAEASGFSQDPLAADRHEHWMELRRQDMDARIVAALVGAGDEFLWAAMSSPSHDDWIEFGFDAFDGEEVVLASYRKKHNFFEEWVRLDRAEDRRPDGRPMPDGALRLDMQHLEVDVDLTRAAKTLSPLGKGEIQPRLGQFDVTVRFVAREDLGRAAQLALTPLASVRSVYRVAADGTETELPFLRHQLGKILSLISEDHNDRQIVVLLDAPVAAGDTFSLRFDYQLEVLNYVSGTQWYPSEDNAILDVHTADVKLLTRKKDEARGMGEALVEGDEAEGGARAWHYRVDRPTRMVTFSFAEDFYEDTVEQDGVPSVTAFANYGGSRVKKKTFNVAADVVNAVNFFQQIFGYPLPTDHIYATAIYGGHGQSFDGFLHLAESTFLSESKGPTERFRAHEAAHQWWGHAVAPLTYRDTWLSEALAEYSAIAFVQVALGEDGQDAYDEIIEVYSGMVKGRLEKASRYVRFGAFQDNDKFRARIGPTGIGYRASTSETPSGYTTQVYVKGAVVMHMLRTSLRSLTRSDDTFFQVLRDFLQTHGGGAASTDDFVAAVERNAPGEWDWFFDQWIHGTAIPTYRWDHEVVQKDGKTMLRLDIEQEGVPEGFRMPVPVQISFGKGPGGKEQMAEIVVMVDEPRKQVEFELPGKPRKVTLNGRHGVLADVKKK